MCGQWPCLKRGSGGILPQKMLKNLSFRGAILSIILACFQGITTSFPGSLQSENLYFGPVKQKQSKLFIRLFL